MKKHCPKCKLVNFPDAAACIRCQFDFVTVSTNEGEKKSLLKSKFFRRAAICVSALIFALFGFYLSLIATSKSLSYEEKKMVQKAIVVLEEKGFSEEIFLLKYLTAFRANDHWLNASVEKENAYAATNFPFEIITLYPDFFTATVDDTERAAILLHEAKHLQGADERGAYEFVWKNRKKLGWTRAAYAHSVIWKNVRKQTREYVPNLFICEINEYGDCTE